MCWHLLGNDLLNDFLNPGGSWVQTDLLPGSLQGGTVKQIKQKISKKNYILASLCTKSLTTHMISVSLQWELGGKSSILSMSLPMRRLSVSMQRQRGSTPRPLRLIPKGKNTTLTIRYVLLNLLPSLCYPLWLFMFELLYYCKSKCTFKWCKKYCVLMANTVIS